MLATQIGDHWWLYLILLGQSMVIGSKYLAQVIWSVRNPDSKDATPKGWTGLTLFGTEAVMATGLFIVSLVKG
jgi:hypothetical protein